ncbi:MAG: hypothetical protein JNL47_11350 [Bacteroidia bacterium]|nr:hypothetical protein [Bacteroidia bacterium]
MKNLHIVSWFFLLPVFAFVSCIKTNDTSSPLKGIPESSPFNPYYFQDDRIAHYVVKLKYKDNTYQLADNKIYKIPGRARKKFNRPDGNFQMIYLDKNNMEIGRLKMFSPRAVLIDKLDSLGTGLPSSHVKLLNETDFVFPLHPSGQTRSIRIMAMETGQLQEFTFNIHLLDTIYIAEQNKQLF